MGSKQTVPKSCEFPQLADLTRGAVLRDSIRREFAAVSNGERAQIVRARVRTVYYTPGESCRLKFSIYWKDGSGRVTKQRYFGRVLDDAACEDAYERARGLSLARPAHGPPVAWLRDLGMVCWAHPNDPDVPGLEILSDPARVRQLLQDDPTSAGLPLGATVRDVDLTVAKYVPGQRCCYRYRIRWTNGERRQREHLVLGKAYRSNAARPVYDIMQRLQANRAFAAGGVRGPRVYGYNARHHIVWQELFPGVPMAQDLEPQAWESAAAKLGRALAALHSTPLDLGPGVRLADEVETLQASASRICAAHPEHADLCGAVVQRLLAASSGLPATPLVPVHGSFKLNHVFEVDGQVAFIDLDGAGIGDPAYDAGRFQAHLAVAALKSDADAALLERTMQRFREAYASEVPWAWSEARVRWYTSSHLISSQAYRCIKRLRPKRLDAILRLADAWFPAA